MFHCPACGEMVLAGMPHPEPFDDDDYWAYMEAEANAESMLDNRIQ
jgi:rRNA maturation protein Nop10